MTNTWKHKRGSLGLTDPIIMGILNTTPDSFSDGGSYDSVETALARALQMQEERADIIDIGGESTRPGAKEISIDEEINRTIPVIKALRNESDILISIDTTKSEVARDAIEAGADIINDISACTFDTGMLSLAKKTGAGLCLMHIKGRPGTMQTAPTYSDVVLEVKNFLAKAAKKALGCGIEKEAIVLDPGIGFGKTKEHNLLLLKNLKELKKLGFPILLGTSRKSFIGKILNNAPVEQRLNGTLATVAWGIMNGVAIHRVHEVKPVKELALVLSAIM